MPLEAPVIRTVGFWLMEGAPACNIHDEYHVLCDMMIIMYLVKQDQGRKKDARKPRAGDGEPPDDPRRSRPAVPRAWVRCRHRSRGHERRRADPWRLLWLLQVQG